MISSVFKPLLRINLIWYFAKNFGKYVPGNFATHLVLTDFVPILLKFFDSLRNTVHMFAFNVTRQKLSYRGCSR